MQRFLAGRVMGVTVSLALVAGISFFYRHILHVNQTTVALSFLLAILAVSAVWGMAVSVAMSLVAEGAVYCFFLSPGGTFSIAGPLKWVPPLFLPASSVIGRQLFSLLRTASRERQPRRR